MLRLCSWIFIASIFGLLSLPIQSAATTCTQGQLSRQIEVVYVNPDLALPCEVLYDKRDEGSQRILWRAENSQGYCEEKAEQLIQKHRAWGWQCSRNDDLESRNTTLEEVTRP